MRLNRMVLRLIEGRAYRLVPSGLTEISYTGPVSGGAIRLPAHSVVDGSRFLVVAGRPERKRWWRSFRRPLAARLVRGGVRYEVVGHVLAGPDRAAALIAYLAACPGNRSGIGPETPVIAFDRLLGATDDGSL
jgi:hypothetical protein